MLLRTLYTYLQEHPQASLAQLSRHFQMEGSALQGPLGVLIRKGRVVMIRKLACQGCHHCPPDSLVFYHISPPVQPRGVKQVGQRGVETDHKQAPATPVVP